MSNDLDIADMPFATPLFVPNNPRSATIPTSTNKVEVIAMKEPSMLLQFKDANIFIGIAINNKLKLKEISIFSISLTLLGFISSALISANMPIIDTKVPKTVPIANNVSATEFILEIPVINANINDSVNNDLHNLITFLTFVLVFSELPISSISFRAIVIINNAANAPANDINAYLTSSNVLGP